MGEGGRGGIGDIPVAAESSLKQFSLNCRLEKSLFVSKLSD